MADCALWWRLGAGDGCEYGQRLRIKNVEYLHVEPSTTDLSDDCVLSHNRSPGGHGGERESFMLRQGPLMGASLVEAKGGRGLPWRVGLRTLFLGAASPTRRPWSAEGLVRLRGVHRLHHTGQSLTVDLPGAISRGDTAE